MNSTSAGFSLKPNEIQQVDPIGSRKGLPREINKVPWINRSIEKERDGRRWPWTCWRWPRPWSRWFQEQSVEHDRWALLPPRALAAQHRHRLVRHRPRLHPHRHEIGRARGADRSFSRFYFLVHTCWSLLVAIDLDPLLLVKLRFFRG